MDFKKMLLDTTDQQNHARWTGGLYALQDTVTYMTNLLKDNDKTYKQFSLELTKYLGAELKRYEKLILTTDMGKKMKEIGANNGT